MQVIIKEVKNVEDNRSFCPFCGSKNISNANFCHSCGKNISLDSKDFRESRKEYANNKAGILKYQGLFQILIGLHGLFLIVGSFMFIFMGISGAMKKDTAVFGFLILLPSAYIFYQYFRYNKFWAYYVFLVFFGFLCIILFFVMFGNPFVLIVFILYCLILWYLYESLKSNSNTQ